MTEVVIYQKAKTPTQSGKAKKYNWYLESLNISEVKVDPLMGWIGQDLSKNTLKLKFNNLEEAVNFAEKESLEYKIIYKNNKKIIIKSYADNFRFNRIKCEK